MDIGNLSTIAVIAVHSSRSVQLIERQLASGVIAFIATSLIVAASNIGSSSSDVDSIDSFLRFLLMASIVQT